HEEAPRPRQAAPPRRRPVAPRRALRRARRGGQAPRRRVPHRGARPRAHRAASLARAGPARPGAGRDPRARRRARDAGGRRGRGGRAVSDLAAVLAIARKDLLQELRSKAATVATVFFTATTLLMMAFALGREQGDRKSTRLNSSHVKISYAVIC